MSDRGVCEQQVGQEAGGQGQIRACHWQSGGIVVSESQVCINFAKMRGAGGQDQKCWR